LKRALVNLALSLAVIVFAAALVESASAFYAHFTAVSPNYDAKQFRLTRPPPYANSPFFSSDFVTESFVEPRGWSMAKEQDFVIPNDFSGHWFNVRDSRRVTIGTPPLPHHRLHLFGASSIYCAEVPDEFTVASLLQSNLNAVAPGEWEVRNYGVPSVNSRQELLRLKSTGIDPGDVVVFYDGPTDLERVYNGNVRGWVIDETRKITDAYTPAEKLLLYINRRLARYSNFIREFVSLRPKRPAAMDDPVRVDANLQMTRETYRSNIHEAAVYAAAHGARFVHFLQPTLFSQASFTPYEERVRKVAVRTYPALDEVYQIGYPALRAAVEDNRQAGIDTHDITSLFNHRPAGEEVYLDFSHLAEVGNTKVAATIFRLAFPQLALLQQQQSAIKP
jgi:hypothetical protein